jgi:hypothetical protein
MTDSFPAELPRRTGLRETEQEPGLKATYLIGHSSTIDPTLSAQVLPLSCDLAAVVLSNSSSYLGAQPGSRNAGRRHQFGIGNGT